MNAGQQVEVLRVIDGDTVEVALKKGLFGKSQTQRIRLYGIDAPESAQRGGQDATKHLQRMIGRRKRIWMDSAGLDQYNRTVAIIYPDKSKPTNSYNIRMLETGHARAYMTRGAHRAPYQRAERQAREANLGIWKHSNAQAPWEWRQRQRARQKAKPKWAFVLLAIGAGAAITFIASPVCTLIS